MEDVALFSLSAGGLERIWPCVLSVMLPLVTSHQRAPAISPKEGVTALWAYLQAVFNRNEGPGTNADGAGESRGAEMVVAGDFFVLEMVGRREALVASRLRGLGLARREELMDMAIKDDKVIPGTLPVVRIHACGLHAAFSTFHPLPVVLHAVLLRNGCMGTRCAFVVQLLAMLTMVASSHRLSHLPCLVGRRDVV